MTEADLAGEVQRWLDENWDETLTVGEWWRRLAGAGYAYPTWPAGVGGRALSPRDAQIVSGVLSANRVIAPPLGGVAARLAAPTILEHGTTAQVEAFVGPIARGEAAWCQLFSEPGSGSDLASIGTRAVRDGDEWVVTGQKVWNSSANVADLGMLLARTDIDQPKHRGITYLLIDMRQPGVEARPLRQMNGQSSFCEVFLNEARVPGDWVLGDHNDGWRVAQTTLFHERNSLIGGGVPGLVPASSGRHGDLDRSVRDVIDRARRHEAEQKGSIRGGAVPSRMMIELAREYGRDTDLVVRQELARYYTQVKVNGWTARRSGAAGGRLTGADGSIAKLATARICQQSRDLSYAIVGAHGVLAGRESPRAGELQTLNLGSPGMRIGGGTDEIQLNVLGERGLGLPREPGDDREIPYRELKVGTQRQPG